MCRTQANKRPLRAKCAASVSKWASFSALAAALSQEDAAKEPGALVDANVRQAVDSVLRWRERLPLLTSRLRDATAPRGIGEEDDRCVVKFTTSHRAKGLEFDVVVVADDFTPLVSQEGKMVGFFWKNTYPAFFLV